MAIKSPQVYYSDTGRVEALRSGDTLTGVSMATPFKCSASFTRPANATAYAVNDGVSNSTSAATVLLLDTNMVNGSTLMITNAKVISSISRSSAQPAFSLFILPTTYTISNDNAAFSVSDTDMELGMSIIPVLNVDYTALNTINYSGALAEQIKLDDSDDTLYVALVTKNAFTPTSAEKFTIYIEGYTVS